MIDAAVRYRELFEELLLLRALAGGQLPQEREADIAGRLDAYWHAMSDEEQEEAEKKLAAASPQAPSVLRYRDVVVNDGAHRAPREAA